MSHPDQPGGTWLQAYLEESARANRCTRVGCTTCGATPFRQGLADRAAVAFGQTSSEVPPLALYREVAQNLALIQPTGGYVHSARFEEAVRLVLYEAWRTTGGPSFDAHLAPLLAGTWAGDVLERMRAHHAALTAARRAFEAYQSPEAVQARREAKRRRRQEQHAQRLALKRERDRIWKEQHEHERV